MITINPLWGHLTGVFILLMMFTFIGIWIWAWRKYHKSTFNRMARLPMEDVPDDLESERKEKHP